MLGSSWRVLVFRNTYSPDRAAIPGDLWNFRHNAWQCNRPNVELFRVRHPLDSEAGILRPSVCAEIPVLRLCGFEDRTVSTNAHDAEEVTGQRNSRALSVQAGHSIQSPAQLCLLEVGRSSPLHLFRWRCVRERRGFRNQLPQHPVDLPRFDELRDHLCARLAALVTAAPAHQATLVRLSVLRVAYFSEQFLSTPCHLSIVSI